jgi:hypothetical protein
VFGSMSSSSQNGFFFECHKSVSHLITGLCKPMLVPNENYCTIPVPFEEIDHFHVVKNNIV